MRMASSRNGLCRALVRLERNKGMSMNLTWYDIKLEDEKYGLLVGTMMCRCGEATPFKQWNMSLYDTERGRKMGIKRALREYPESDCLIFSIKGKDFFDKAHEFFDFLPEKGRAKGETYDQDILGFMRSKRTAH